MGSIGNCPGLQGYAQDPVCNLKVSVHASCDCRAGVTCECIQSSAVSQCNRVIVCQPKEIAVLCNPTGKLPWCSQSESTNHAGFVMQSEVCVCTRCCATRQGTCLGVVSQSLPIMQDLKCNLELSVHASHTVHFNRGPALVQSVRTYQSCIQLSTFSVNGSGWHKTASTDPSTKIDDVMYGHS